jgi:hypothetical protein
MVSLGGLISVVSIPVLGPLGLWFMALLFGAAGVRRLRWRRD